MEPDRDRGPDPPDERHGEARLRLGKHVRTGKFEIADPARGLPPPGKVAIEIHTACVLSRAAGDTVRIEIAHNPQIRAFTSSIRKQIARYGDARRLVPVDRANDQDHRTASRADMQRPKLAALGRTRYEHVPRRAWG